MAKNIKGRKFVATAASAALVASAIVPVASASTEFGDASQISSWAKEAVDYLVSQNILEGDEKGNFNPKKELTRGEAATVLAKALGLTIDTSKKTTLTDAANHWSSSAIAAIQASNPEIIKGYEDGTFKPDGKITRQEFAKMIVTAFELELVEGADVNFADNKGWGADFITILASNGIATGTSATTFGPEENVTREAAATFAHRTLVEEARVDVVKGDVALTSVKAINAKTIEITFNKAVADTSKATIELLRGTFKQNATVVWAADKKSVQLVGASNFQVAEYTVKVSGLSTKELTSTIKIEAQKVVSIEILSDVAVVSSSTAGAVSSGATATVAYMVKDQYGTDVSKNFSVTTNSQNIKASNGVVTIAAAEIAGKKLGDLVPVVLVDTNTGVSTTKTLKLSAEPAVSTIAVAGIFNAKGEAVALNDKSVASSAYIVLDLKDQYGKEITNPTVAAGLVITNTNPYNIDIENAVSKVTIGGKDKLVIKIKSIKQAGNTDVLLISTTNGTSTKYTVEVAETSATDSISVSQPEIAVAKETTLVPITVTDKNGNVITDKKLLSDAAKGIKLGGTTVSAADLEVKDGQVYYKTTFASAGNQALVFTTSTFKVATVTINVQAEAKPTVVRGLKSPLVISTKQSPVTITAAKHLVIEDQYGREMKNSTAAVTVTVVGTTDVLEVSNNTVTAKKNGTATLKVALVTQNGTIDSAVEVQVKVTDGTEYSGYEIAEIGKTQAGKDKAFTIYGLLDNGKVELTSGEYTAVLSGGKLPSTTVTGDSFVIDTAKLDTNTAGTAPIDTEFTLKVTINATGKVLESKFVVSATAPATQEFFFTASAANSAYNAAKEITEATLVSGASIATALKSTDETPATVNIATVDQYGNTAVVGISTATATITIVPEKAGEVTITGNGTANAKVELNGVEESVVTVKVTIGGASKEIKVKVVK